MSEEERYCLCKQPYNGKFMIECDRCQEWYHGQCVGQTKTSVEAKGDGVEWLCPCCAPDHWTKGLWVKKIKDEICPSDLVSALSAPPNKNELIDVEGTTRAATSLSCCKVPFKNHIRSRLSLSYRPPTKK